MKKLSVVWGFDNFNQYDFLLISIKSFVNSNFKNRGLIDTIFVLEKSLKDDINFERFLSELNNELKGFKIKIHFITSSGSKKKGQFNYLYAPNISMADYTLAVDNDTFINIDFVQLVENIERNSKSKIKAIHSVSTKIAETWKHVKPIKGMFEKEEWDLAKDYWFNAGLVLINNELWRSKFKTNRVLIKKIREFSKMVPESLEESDEGFLILHFYNNIGKLEERYNVRLHVPIELEENIFSGNYVHHFMTRYLDEKTASFVKFDWNWFYNSKKSNKIKAKKVYKFYKKIWKMWNNESIIIEKKDFFILIEKLLDDSTFISEVKK